MLEVSESNQLWNVVTLIKKNIKFKKFMSQGLKVIRFKWLNRCNSIKDNHRYKHRLVNSLEFPSKPL